MRRRKTDKDKSSSSSISVDRLKIERNSLKMNMFVKYVLQQPLMQCLTRKRKISIHMLNNALKNGKTVVKM